jgi:hypothetical protein
VSVSDQNYAERNQRSHTHLIGSLAPMGDSLEKNGYAVSQKQLQVDKC